MIKYAPLVMAFEPKSAAELREHAIAVARRLGRVTRTQPIEKPKGQTLPERLKAFDQLRFEEAASALHEQKAKRRAAPRRKREPKPDITGAIIDILHAVSEHYGVPVPALVERCRKQEHVLPTQVCMYLMRTRLTLSFSKVGKRMGRPEVVVQSAIKVIVKNPPTADLAAINERLNATEAQRAAA